jgi:hypothetical protein
MLLWLIGMNAAKRSNRRMHPTLNFHVSVTYSWYLLWAAAVAGWAFIDARARLASPHWVAAVAIAGPIGLAAYLAFRPLRHGESREGGRMRQFLSMLVVWWTALLAFAALWNIVLPFADLAAIAVPWAFISIPALVVGIALKRNTTEHGPTGVLSATKPFFAKCERTADGRAYICRECGKEYPVELPFCDGCGAWPGQSG